MPTYFIIVFIIFFINILHASTIKVKFFNDYLSLKNLSIIGSLLKIQESNYYFIEGASSNANIIVYSNNTILHFFNSCISTKYGPTIHIKENLSNITLIMENTTIKNRKNTIIKVSRDSELTIKGLLSVVEGNNIIETDTGKYLKIENFLNISNDKSYMEKSIINAPLKIIDKFFYSCIGKYIINNIKITLRNISKEVLSKYLDQSVNINNKNCEIRLKNSNNIIFYDNIFSEVFIKNKFIKEKIKNNKLNLNVVVSFTTSKEKLESFLVDRMIKSLFNQTIIPFKIVLTINEENFKYISDFLKLLIENNTIEVIFDTKNLSDFSKYYYVSKKYKNFPIIIIDDNEELERNAIENLLKSYLLNPNAISARRVFKMTFDSLWNLKPFKSWIEDFKKEKYPKFYLFAINGAGTLFPPNFLEFNKNNLYYFKKMFSGSDIFLKYIELKKNIKTIYVNNNKEFSLLDEYYYQKYINLLTLALNKKQIKDDFGKNVDFDKYKNIIKENVIISDEVKNFFLTTTNRYRLNNDTLIVSLSSSFRNIKGVFDVLISLLYQSADISSYQCILTLAKEEFINKENDLPHQLQILIRNKWVKLLWYHDINSYKSIFPIINIYPNNDILIVNDDIKRPYNFIKVFQEDHKINSTNILCGYFEYYFDNQMTINNFNGYKQINNEKINSVPDVIFQTAIPSGGKGGILYPKYTFKDIRFFNETLFMNLAPTFDNIWQYVFNIIENRTLKQISKIFDNSLNYINNSKIMKLNSITEINKYEEINKIMINYFPEYKINSLKRQEKIIVSVTSYKERFKKLHIVLNSILKNKMKPSKIILTIHKDDYPYLTKKLKKLIKNKKVELIISNIDLKPHLKYFEVMKRYRNYAIITIDDDIIYTDDLIESLYNSYLKNPNYIHARRVHKILISQNKLVSYNNWLKDYTMEFDPSFELFATNVGGTLYPPNILNITDENINEIYKCITADDIYLKYLENLRNIKVIWVPNKHVLGLKTLDDKNTQKKALYKVNTKGEILNDIYLNIFNII